MMKKLLTAILAASTAGTMLFAQAGKEREMKKGWNVGLFPTATYSTDTGFQWGAFGDIYYYGDGSTYPDPLHRISWEASHFTKGRTRLYASYDSKHLIPRMRLNVSGTYVDDPMYNFWGYNGTAALQDYSLWANKTDFAPGINYYGISRKMFRALANVQHHITEHFNWAAGINYWHWVIGDMRESPKNDNRYSTDVTLYRRYQEIGAIRPGEATGGDALELNAGVVYDTRDIEAAPNHGIWVEAYLNGNVLGNGYLKACTYFRHYLSIPIHLSSGDPVFAYRLAWQQTVAGETPFYMIQNVPLLVQRNMISEGFGSDNTVRGIRENRVLAEGFAWVNAELRIKFINFKLFNQYFYIAANPFFDAGIITKGYREQVFETEANTLDPNIPSESKAIYDPGKMGDIIYSAGAGLKLAMNQNFVLSLELAHCFYAPMIADPWIGMGLNYQF